MRFASKMGRKSARDGQQNRLADLADLADLAISALSQYVAKSDSVHVCQMQLADMVQPPVNDRPERRSKGESGLGRGFFADSADEHGWRNINPRTSA